MLKIIFILISAISWGILESIVYYRGFPKMATLFTGSILILPYLVGIYDRTVNIGLAIGLWDLVAMLSFILISMFFVSTTVPLSKILPYIFIGFIGIGLLWWATDKMSILLK